ncbi:Fc.00g005690.m01.CDS01 [Cosmosporella sp. VM-42]
MATESSISKSESTPGTGTPSSQLTVNLQVLSPSVGVNRPLLFSGLAASTTVKQLKEKIRQTLPLRPPDENQRLIHRGRAIVRETDSLLDIFGAETLRNPEQHTIHLVIRDAHDTHTPTPPTAARGPSPTAPVQPANAPRQNVHHSPFGPHPPPGLPRRNPMPPTANPFPQPRMPSPSPIHTPEQAAAFQHQHQNMTQWLTHLQREAMARALVTQNQRNRAQLGMRGIGDAAGNGAQVGGDGSGRGSPAPGHTIYREHVGPNGHTYQVETVIRTSAPAAPHGGASPADIQNIIRGADANQATLTMTNAMHRSASNTSLHNRPLTQPGVTTPIFGFSNNAGSSGRATPDPVITRPAGGLSTTATTPGSTQTRQGLDVYILSSPEGPRALLMNHSNLETFYTPRLRNQPLVPNLAPTWYPQPPVNPPGLDIQNQNRPHHHHHHHHHHPRQPQQQQQHNPPTPQQEPRPQVQVQDQAPVQQQLQQQDPPGQIRLGHPGNPPAAALPPLLLQLWPQIWLLFRLALFVWFFTSPNATWSRWLTIICVAVFIFVLSTGVLNGLGDLTRRALGRHLENLIPPLDGQQNARNQQDGGAGENQGPNPAEMAARLVAERHGRENWVLSQLRRGERAILLFLASIAPGVAERHIANLEAQERAERAERERRETEAAEAARAAEEAAAAGNNETTDATDHAGDGTQEGDRSGGSARNDVNEEWESVERSDSQSLQDQPRAQDGSGTDDTRGVQATTKSSQGNS